jgi:hypothetical protein
MPTHIVAPMFGMALYSAKALGGRAGDAWELMTENL